MPYQMTDSNPLVSIGLPIYNCEKFVAQAIASVINQTYTNWELIVTDDGSTDKSIEIIETFQDNRINIIKDDINRGIADRLNQQIKLANGEYFCRMDADDIMFPDRIRHQLSYLETYRDVSAISSSAIIIDDRNTIIGLRKSFSSGTETVMDIISGKSGHIHPTVFGRISFFKKYLYNPEFNGIEDFDLWIRTIGNDKMISMNTPLLFYRDPLKFKYKTYAGRLETLVKYYGILHAERRLSMSLYYKLVATIKLKQMAAKILNTIGLDKIFISRRNNSVSDLESFNRTLQIAIER